MVKKKYSNISKWALNPSKSGKRLKPKAIPPFWGDVGLIKWYVSDFGTATPPFLLLLFLLIPTLFLILTYGFVRERNSRSQCQTKRLTSLYCRTYWTNKVPILEIAKCPRSQYWSNIQVLYTETGYFLCGKSHRIKDSMFREAII